MSITHADLKTRQRAEREGHSEGLAVDLHLKLTQDLHLILTHQDCLRELTVCIARPDGGLF